MIYLAGKLFTEKSTQKLSNNACIFYLALFLITHCIYFYGIFTQNQITTTYIGLISIAISIVVSLFIYKSKSSTETE